MLHVLRALHDSDIIDEITKDSTEYIRCREEKRLLLSVKLSLGQLAIAVEDPTVFRPLRPHHGIDSNRSVQSFWNHRAP